MHLKNCVERPVKLCSNQILCLTGSLYRRKAHCKSAVHLRAIQHAKQSALPGCVLRRSYQGLRCSHHGVSSDADRTRALVLQNCAHRSVLFRVCEPADNSRSGNLKLSCSREAIFCTIQCLLHCRSYACDLNAAFYSLAFRGVFYLLNKVFI